MAQVAPAAMLQPLVALAALTGLVWLRMYQLRFAEMTRRRIDPQALALSAPKHPTLEDTRGSDNFRNLLELPVLFYAGVLACVQLGLQDAVFLGLAWAFVALRVLHSLVHCGYNRVAHRFVVYALGALVLFGFWARLAWLLLG